MVLSNLQHSGRVESLHPLFKTVFDYVKSHDLLNTPCGRIELQGDDLFINNVNPECVAADKQVLEVHRQYIDIHILLEGEETIYKTGYKSTLKTHRLESYRGLHERDETLRCRSRLRSLCRTGFRLREDASGRVPHRVARRPTRTGDWRGKDSQTDC